MPWPATAKRADDGQLAIGGVPTARLVTAFGTPLYVFDEATLRERARSIRQSFAAAYPRSRVVYAGKANLSPAIVAILWDEGLGLDVVSGGEIYAGLLAGVPASAMTFHGNNKDEAELREALAAGVGLFAIDNDWEIELLARQVAAARPTRCLLRLNPGIDAHTHDKLRTGALESKFGFPIRCGGAAAAVARILAVPGLELVGYHAHVGSQIFDPALVGRTIAVLLAFAAEMRDRHRLVPAIVSPGGGFGVADDASGDDVAITDWAQTAGAALRDGCARLGLPLPELVVEPGRTIIGPAGVALYRVGARKEIPGGRTYVAVDGGMADNIRPALYGARYSAAVANRRPAGPTETVTIAGKYCESGDLLVTDIELPPIVSGDVLAVPMVGAYCLAMASNYNLAPRPAAVIVANGEARLIRRRETYADVLAAEIVPVPGAAAGAGRVAEGGGDVVA